MMEVGGRRGRNGDKDPTSLPPGTLRCGDRDRARLPPGAESRAVTLQHGTPGLSAPWRRSRLQAEDQEPRSPCEQLPHSGLLLRDRKKDAQCLRADRPPAADGPPSLAWGQVSSVSRWLRPASLWPRGIRSENARWAAPASFPGDRTARHRDRVPSAPLWSPHLPDPGENGTNGRGAGENCKNKLQPELRLPLARCGAPGALGNDLRLVDTDAFWFPAESAKIQQESRAARGRRRAAYVTGFVFTVPPSERTAILTMFASDTDRLQIRRRDSCSGRQPPPTPAGPPPRLATQRPGLVQRVTNAYTGP